MGTNNKNFHDHQRTFNNTSPNTKKYSSGSQRPSPSKSINIKTPNKNGGAGYSKNNSYNSSNNSSRLSLSGSPTSYFAASKCFESPSPDSLPQPPSTWMMINNINDNNNDSTTTVSSTNKLQAHRVRKALIMPPMENIYMNSCAFSMMDKNDHFTQNLKLLLNVNA